jgi:hypothetical protein
MVDPSDIIKRHKVAETLRLNMCSIWRDIGAQGDPLNKDIGLDTSSAPSITGGIDIFDSTIQEAAKVYSSGCLEWLTPYQTKWVAYSAPHYLRGDDSAKSWYSRCTDIALEVLAGTNFYSEIHDLYGIDGLYGTSGIMMREDSRYGLHFDSLQIGEFSILEDNRKNVDTLFRISKFSPRQAAKEFGENKLPDKIREALKDPANCDKEDGEYLNFIGPREDRNRFRSNMQNAPIASVWIEMNSKQVVKESGFNEQPFAIHRHLRFGRIPYGRSPGMLAIFDARQLNYMQKQLDTLVEKTVTPPVIAPAEFEGVIDLSAGGLTMTPDMQNRPDYFGNPGNYMVGEDRIEFRRRQINNCFHVELFQTLASVPAGKVMTAEEVRQRRNDRLPTFSPTFARKNREINDPVMRLVFQTLLRLGAFPPPPPNLVQQLDDGSAYVPDPQIVYSSRMALALQTIHNDAFLESLNLAGQIAQMDPSVMDNIDLDEGFRNYSRNAGLQESTIRPEIERDQMRQQRAEAQAQAEQEASQLEEADAVAKLAPAVQA